MIARRNDTHEPLAGVGARRARANAGVSLQCALPFAEETRVGNRAEPENPHLAAARRLSRRMKRLADRSVEQTRAGQAICQHLKALLASESRG